MTTTTDPTITHLAGCTIELRDLTSLGPERLAQHRTTLAGVLQGHVTDDSLNGPALRHDPPALAVPIWDELIADIPNLPEFASAADAGAAVARLRALAAGGHPRGWPVSPSTKAAAAGLLHTLGDRSAATLLATIVNGAR